MNAYKEMPARNADASYSNADPDAKLFAYRLF